MVKSPKMVAPHLMPPTQMRLSKEAPVVYMEDMGMRSKNTTPERESDVPLSPATKTNSDLSQILNTPIFDV